jgi:5'-3' exonuclease
LKTRTLLIDSNYLLKRSFFGAKDLHTPQFGHIGALYSFMTTLRKMITQYTSNKVVLVWDGENGGKQRFLIERSYKANRKDKSWYEKIELTEAEIRRERDKEESVLKQRKRIQQYCEELFLRQIEVDEIEADDIIAEYCMRNHEKEEIMLFTNDRDFAQLLDLNLTIKFSNLETPINSENFLYFFNYHYSNVLAMKVVCGDVSDNLKGVDNIKEKTLLKYFPEMQYRNVTVKEICQKSVMLNKQRVDEGKKPLKSLENITKSVKILKTNHRLMNLREPFLSDIAIEEIEQLEMPLSPEGRGSKNLNKLMIEDGFLTVWGSTFVNYVQPFYSVIMNELDAYKKYVGKK